MVTEISRQICQKVEFRHSKWPPGGHLGSDRPNFFVYRWALWGYILIPNLTWLSYPIVKISHQNDSVYDDDDDDDGRRRRRTQSECNSPLVLRTKWAKKEGERGRLSTLLSCQMRPTELLVNMK